MLILVLLSGFAAEAASATTHGSSGDPSPQKAPPVGSSSTPAPDPTPQAAVKSQPSHSAPPSTHSAPPPTYSAPSEVIPRTVPTVVTPVSPRVVHTTTQSHPSSESAHVASVPAHKAAPTAPTPHRPARVTHAPPPRHLPAANTTKPQRISLSFPLAFLTRELFRLPRAALHAGEADHRDGALLLLSSLAMGVVAVSSFTLLRRLKRLEEQT